MNAFTLLAAGILIAQQPSAPRVNLGEPLSSTSKAGSMSSLSSDHLEDHTQDQAMPNPGYLPLRKHHTCPSTAGSTDCAPPFIPLTPTKRRSSASSEEYTWDRLFPNCYLEELQELKRLRQEFYPFRFTLGAWHWAHLNNDGPGQSGYGLPPNLEGTYYWYVLADVELWKNADDSFVKAVGARTDYRLREEDRFRPFFHDAYWAWEAYFYADTQWGQFKAGQIWKRFGLDWDGTFWGNIPYFDGFKLDPDWGFSWEHTWNLHDDLTMDTFVQYFVHEDGINGSIAGGGPDSIPGMHEKHFGVVRLLPKWTFWDDHQISLGASGMLGKIENEVTVLGGKNDVNGAWAVDVDYNYKKVKLFAEYLQSYGIRTPAHYVNGAPSDRIDNLLCGVHYKAGPATFRFSYSAGWYHNPGGFQDLFVPGVTVALTKNMDFYFEYVRWNTRDENSIFAEFEDGYQFILNWRY